MPPLKFKAGTKKLPSSQRHYRSDFPNGFVKPQLCELVKSPPVGENWVMAVAPAGGAASPLFPRLCRSLAEGGIGFVGGRALLRWRHGFP
jgi:hypothetical protein